MVEKNNICTYLGYNIPYEEEKNLNVKAVKLLKCYEL
jgi:hypothetical protein